MKTGRIKNIIAAALVCALTSTSAHAQVTIDVAKITCEQYVLYKIVSPEKIAIWLSGYYNAKRSNTIISPQALEGNASKVKEYCRANPAVPVMQAVEAVVSMEK